MTEKESKMYMLDEAVQFPGVKVISTANLRYLSPYGRHILSLLIVGEVNGPACPGDFFVYIGLELVQR